jgi:uncharacterized protein (TIGR02466 family)
VTDLLAGGAGTASEVSFDGSIYAMFATPVARFAHPAAQTLNQQLSALVLARAETADKAFGYKRETLGNMADWDDPVTSKLTTWVLACARQMVAASLRDALSKARQSRLGEENQSLSVVAGNSWASLYTTGDRHPPHYHPNTALAAIYYVQSPASCALELHDPRPYIDYYDPGVTFGGADQNVRLNCRPGELLIFPGWLQHSVPEFAADGIRISLSWNLDFVVGPSPAS